MLGLVTSVEKVRRSEALAEARGMTVESLDRTKFDTTNGIVTATLDGAERRHEEDDCDDDGDGDDGKDGDDDDDLGVKARAGELMGKTGSHIG